MPFGPTNAAKRLSARNPHRLHRVSVYREAERDFATGDRVQFTAPYREEHIANRQLGSVEQIDAEGNLHVRLDSGQEVQSNIREHPHVDYGYAVTSHSSQGATADRVLVHVRASYGQASCLPFPSRDKIPAREDAHEGRPFGWPMSPSRVGVLTRR